MRVPTRKTNRIVQIDVTSRCDKACANCTRALAQIRKPDMTPDQFESAVKASFNWIIRERGVLSIFGGNAAISPHFEEYCRILSDYLPEKNRGLWINNLLGKGAIARKYFGPESTYNFNVHQDHEAAKQFREFFPFAKVWGENRRSMHASLFVASQDFMEEEEIWKAVERCTYDIEWSAIVVQEAPDWTSLGGYSCEIASTHARVNGVALGIPVTEGWLDCKLNDVRHQYEFACRRCSGAMNLKAVPDLGEGAVDQFSSSNAHLVQLNISKTRPHEIVEHAELNDHSAIDYMRLR